MGNLIRITLEQRHLDAGDIEYADLHPLALALEEAGFKGVYVGYGEVDFCGMIHTVKIRRYFPSHAADAVEAIERGEKVALPVVFDLPDIHDAFPECHYGFVRNLIKCIVKT